MEMAGCSHEGTVGEGGAEGAIDRTDEHSSIDWCDEDFDTTGGKKKLANACTKLGCHFRY
ncbi:hypothetical protein SPONL_1898 [uncultured Candidatus Thioglobus sp.]|nr:hypothetical protein SPONL_1898 [uncultured Candidatus Thioglobus sp.]